MWKKVGDIQQGFFFFFLVVVTLYLSHEQKKRVWSIEPKMKRRLFNCSRYGGIWVRWRKVVHTQQTVKIHMSCYANNLRNTPMSGTRPIVSSFTYLLNHNIMAQLARDVEYPDSFSTER